jgi:glycosyltransferase involved in cell wall biosynthesis
MTDVSGIRPRMSVVIPHYNHADLLPEALDAIARQTMPPFEVVVVDDGSADESVARLASLAEKLPWLQICRHPENRGVNAACNTGLNLVSGDFVLFSAADDRLSTTMIEHAFAAAAAFPQTGVVFSDHVEMSADGSDTRIVPLDLRTTRRYFSADEFVRLMQSHFFYFHVSNVWFNVPLLRELGGFPLDVKWHGDLLAAYAAAFDRGAVYTPDSVSYVRISPTSYGAGRVAQQRAAGGLTRLAGGDQTARRERRRAALVAAAVWPDYRLQAVRALIEDSGYITFQLARWLVWLSIWTKLAPVFGTGFRRWLRAARTQYRRWLWHAQ